MIPFDKNYLSLIDSLCVISSKVVIENGERVKIFNGNAGKDSTLFYDLSAPVEKFLFDIPKIAFNNFHDFFQIMNSFQAPVLALKENKLTIKKDKSKFSYVLAEPEIIECEVFINLDDFKLSSTFNISDNELVEIKKMVNLIRTCEKGSDIVWTEIKSEEGKLKIVFHTHNHNNSFEQDFDYKVESEEPNAKVAADVFTALPKGNYEVFVYNGSIVRFKLVSEEFDLNIYAGVKNE
jgi:hypothetical protein